MARRPPAPRPCRPRRRPRRSRAGSPEPGGSSSRPREIGGRVSATSTARPAEPTRPGRLDGSPDQLVDRHARAPRPQAAGLDARQVEHALDESAEPPGLALHVVEDGVAVGPSGRERKAPAAVRIAVRGCGGRGRRSGAAPCAADPSPPANAPHALVHQALAADGEGHDAGEGLQERHRLRRRARARRGRPPGSRRPDRAWRSASRGRPCAGATTASSDGLRPTVARRPRRRSTAAADSPATASTTPLESSTRRQAPRSAWPSTTSAQRAAQGRAPGAGCGSSPWWRPAAASGRARGARRCARPPAAGRRTSASTAATRR